MKPADRKADILAAAITAAEKCGFGAVRQKDIAEQADCAFGLVTRYFNTMKQMRRAIMREAVRTKNLKIIAQGLAIADIDARKAPPELKVKAAKLLATI